MSDAPLRLVLTGPESTGKTWLADRLATELGLPVSAEAAREIAAARGAPLDATDIDGVARRQIEIEEAALAEAREVGARAVLHDTDLVSTVVYGRHYNGFCPEWIEREAERRRAHLYLLLLPDVPFAPDPGQRGSAEDRLAQLPLFRQVLDGIGARRLEIGGGWVARARRVRSAVEDALGRARRP